MGVRAALRRASLLFHLPVRLLFRLPGKCRGGHVAMGALP